MPCAFRIPVRIEMIAVFVALGQRACDGVSCPPGACGWDSISAVVSRRLQTKVPAAVVLSGRAPEDQN
jgi:hypothetical protein